MTRDDARQLAERLSFDALWLSPLALFFCQDSIWVVLVTAVFAACATKSLRSLREDASTTEGDVPVNVAPEPFQLLDPAVGLKQFASAIVMAFCAEIGIAATFAFSPRVGALLVGASFAIWFSTGQVRTHRWPESRPRQSLTLTLAMILTAAGLMHYIAGSGTLGRLGFFPSVPHGFSQRQRALVSNESGSEARGAYPGIVLWPEKQTVTKLVAPPPVLNHAIFAGERSQSPLSIPFNGVYWFLRAPASRPPQGTREAHGSPERFTMRSTDYHAIAMEARQNLGSLINLDCCKKIQVTIRNADRYPRSVAVELILINTTLAGKPSQSLGKSVVRSTLSWTANDNRPAVSETLNFDVPAGAMHRFDEVKVIFHLDPHRSQFAAKMGIDQFVLVPR
jgi:hypothetical protein